jgi:hypothetical protein
MMGFASAGVIIGSCNMAHDVKDALMPRNHGPRGSRTILKENAGKAFREECRKAR